MDETQLHSLISKGENESVDFKRELDFSSARSKAEFVKDVISIANSSSKKGYLLIGVDDDRYIIGIDTLDEEEIQKLAYKHISPAVSINCFYVSISADEKTKKVGVIEIIALRKPHKVGRSIEHINQEEVYIRRGSMVMKASPEEIIDMHHNSEGIQAKLDNLCQRAKAHEKIGNFSSAVSLYSEAINILPTTELLLLRQYLRQLAR